MIYNQRKLKELDNTKLRRNEIGKKDKKKEIILRNFSCPCTYVHIMYKARETRRYGVYG